MLEIKDFIKQALLQVSEAVIESQAELEAKTNVFKISPVTDDHKFDYNIREIEFDVAVSATDENSAKGGGQIRVLSARIGAEADRSQSGSTVSRIKFTIPVGFKAELKEHKYKSIMR